MEISPCVLLSRLLIVFVLNLVLNIWISYEAYTSLGHYKTNHVEDAKSEKYRDGLIILIMFTVVGVLLLFLGPVLLLWHRTQRKMEKSRINILSCSFICGTVVQFGVALNFSHFNAADDMAARNQTLQDCVTLDQGDDTIRIFYALLVALLFLIISSMVYPYPRREDFSTSLIIGFNAFDVLDLSELTFSDIGCIQNYNGGWQTAFYFALGMSAIMTTIYCGLENGDQDFKPDFKDFLATGVNWVFNDVLYIVIRSKVIYEQKHAYFTLIFMMKECLSVVIRGALFVYHLGKKCYCF